MEISTLIGALEYLGITKEKVIPNLIIFAFAYWFLARKIDKFSHTLEMVKKSILEIHTTMRARWKVSFDQTIDKYGQAASPMVLKGEFRPFVTKSGLESQIESKKAELTEWLRNQNPSTGIDAQDKIATLVVSNEIEKYIDLTEYKKFLYKKGKTLRDAYGILTVYLFEKLIPVVFP